jgi:hypothetical protein
MKNFISLFKKNSLNLLNINQLLFYSFPIILFFPSGVINLHITLFTIFGLITIYRLKKKNKIIFVDYFILFFFFLNFINTLNNFLTLNDEILVKSIFSFRFFIFFWVIRSLLVYKIVGLLPLSIISLTSSILLSIDIFLQHLTGFDIFGFPPFSGRFNGFFEHEAIAGSYIQKFLLISLLTILLLNQNKIMKIITITLIINILGLGTLLSLDRMPYIIFLFSIILLFFFLNKLRKILILNLAILILIFITFLKNYDIIKIRYEYFNRDINFYKILNLPIFKKRIDNFHYNIQVYNTQSDDAFFYGDYSKLFRAAYLVSLKNNFIGTGHKSFGFQCIKLKIKNISCNNHPHNIYLEILVNLGILGVFIFIIILFLHINKITKFLIKKNINEKKKITLILFVTFFMAEFIPLRSYGSIFSTINGSIFWFFLGLLIYINNFYINKNSKNH